MPLGGPKADVVLSGAERSQSSSMARSRSISAALSLRARWCRCHAQGKGTRSSTLQPVSWDSSTACSFVPATYDRGEGAAVACEAQVISADVFDDASAGARFPEVTANTAPIQLVALERSGANQSSRSGARSYEDLPTVLRRQQ
jgi:hypothetical protein